MNHEPMARAAGIRMVSDWIRVLLCALGMAGCATPAPPVAPLSDAETRLAAAAASVAEALARLAQGGIDAVLLDLMMPGMDGAETLRRIRATHGRTVPVVAMTADVLAIRSDDALRQALDGFLPKPILPETLREVLTKVLHRI